MLTELLRGEGGGNNTRVISLGRRRVESWNPMVCI